MRQVRRALWTSQIALSSLLVLCTVMAPNVAASDGGVSNFGNRALTVAPYTASFALSALFVGLAAGQLVKIMPTRWWPPTVLVFLALLDLLVLVSTYPRHLSVTYSEVHDDLGIALFAYEFVLTIWFAVRSWKVATAIFVTIEVGGSFIGLLSALKVLHLLYWGQMIGGVGFALLLVTSFPRLVELGRPDSNRTSVGEGGDRFARRVIDE